MPPVTQDTRRLDGGVSSAGGGGISYLSSVTGGGKPGRIRTSCLGDRSCKLHQEGPIGSAARRLLGEHGIHDVVENEEV